MRQIFTKKGTKYTCGIEFDASEVEMMVSNMPNKAGSHFIVLQLTQDNSDFTSKPGETKIDLANLGRFGDTGNFSCWRGLMMKGAAVELAKIKWNELGEKRQKKISKKSSKKKKDMEPEEVEEVEEVYEEEEQGEEDEDEEGNMEDEEIAKKASEKRDIKKVKKGSDGAPIKKQKLH